MSEVPLLLVNFESRISNLEFRNVHEICIRNRCGLEFLESSCVRRRTLLSYAILPSGGSFADAARKVPGRLLKKLPSPMQISRLRLRPAMDLRPLILRTAPWPISHAMRRGFIISFLAGTVMDIGSQFCRAIKLDEDGRVTNFVQNEKCAGGSGKFLQVTREYSI